MPVPLNVPPSFVAGDAVIWQSTDLSGLSPSTGDQVDYTPAGYALRFVLLSQSGSTTVNADADGNNYKTSLLGTETAGFGGQSLAWYAIIQDAGGNELTLAHGRIDVGVDPRTVTSQDVRTEAEKQLIAVDAAIAARIAGTDVEEYRIGQRSIRNMTLTELRELRSELKARVNRESGKGRRNKSLIQFSNGNTRIAGGFPW